MPKKSEKQNEDTIQESLTKLEDIASWFEKDSDFDVEEGLKKVKEGVALVKELRMRLKDVENEFRELKIDLEGV
jgi:exodeoxyribonuclease VII small subunit